MTTLAVLRQNARLTPRELAHKAGVDEGVIVRIEAGQRIPPLDQFRRICDVVQSPMETVTLPAWERIIRTHRLWYHLHAHATDDGWIARCHGIDPTARLSLSDRYAAMPTLIHPMDESDATLTGPDVPVTLNWEENGESAEDAIQRLADRITIALDRADR